MIKNSRIQYPYSAFVLARNPPISLDALTGLIYNGFMAADRTKPLAGKELEALIQRDKEAVASLACEGIHCTPEEDAVFEEMNRLNLSYDERIKHLNDYFDRTSKIPPNASE